MDSFWWWLLAAVVGGLIAAFGRELVTLFVTDRIREKRKEQASTFERNRAALQKLIEPLSSAFEIIDRYHRTVINATDSVLPTSFPIGEALKAVDRSWSLEANAVVSDPEVRKAYADANPLGLVRFWAERTSDQTREEMADTAVKLHNALNGLRVAMAPYLPGWSPESEKRDEDKLP